MVASAALDAVTPWPVDLARGHNFTLDRADISRGLAHGLGQAQSQASGFIHKLESGQPVTGTRSERRITVRKQSGTRESGDDRDIQTGFRV